MTGQPRDIRDILMDRLRITQDIAAENVEHLRLSQKASGLMVLAMKDQEDGITDIDHETARIRNFAALEECMERINLLEAQMKAIDQELQAAEKDEGK